MSDVTIAQMNASPSAQLTDLIETLTATNIPYKATLQQVVTLFDANIQLPSTAKVTGLDTALAGKLAIASNLSDLQNAGAARTNLGLEIGVDIPSPTGTGATGTWGISISGNANTATTASSVINGVYTTDTGTVTNTMLAGSIANAKLANSSITVNGTSIALGASDTVTAAAGTLTGNTLAAGVTESSLKSLGILNFLDLNYTPGFRMRFQIADSAMDNRVLNWTFGDADRAIVLQGNLTVSANTTISGTNTGDQTSVSGNAGSATILQTSRDINGVSFNGSANITVVSNTPCAFLAKLDNSTSDNVTGDGTDYTIQLNEVFDIGNNFSSFTFTAPNTGRYQLNGCVTLQNVGSSTNAEIKIVTTGIVINGNRGSSSANGPNPALVASCLIQMTAGDTATLHIVASNSTKTVGVAGGSSTNTFFSGFQVT